MSKRHFLVYDFLLPIAIILGIGHLLSARFDAALFAWLDQAKAFGLGQWFSHSPLRGTLWQHAYLVFAAPAALLWLLWVRINVERDWVNGGRRLDRPLYKFVRGIFRWIDGDESARMAVQTAEFRAAQSEDRARRLEAELIHSRQEVADLESINQRLESELQGELEPETHETHETQPR